MRGDGDRRDEFVEAITVFEDVSEERYWHHRYVEALLGAGYDPANGKPYYRVGYCPVALDGELAVATSFLPPGFKKTPEFEAICRSNLPFAEKKRLKDMATDEMTYPMRSSRTVLMLTNWEVVGKLRDEDMPRELLAVVLATRLGEFGWTTRAAHDEAGGGPADPDASASSSAFRNRWPSGCLSFTVHGSPRMW